MTQRHGARHIVLALALGTTLAMSGCGNSSDPDPADKPSGRESIASGGPSARAILPTDALPTGWRYATIGDFLGIPKMCGVVLEPPGLSSATTKRFATREADRFVIQYSFVSSDEAGTTARIDEFVKAASTCASYQPNKALDAAATVTPLEGVSAVGDAFAAVTAVDDTDPNNRREYVVFRHGSHVTVLLSYGIGGRVASPKDLTAMAAAIDQRVAGT